MSYRLAAALGCLAAFGALAFAFFLQFFMGLEPCALCWLQRGAMLVTGVFFLIAALHAPRAIGRGVYAALVLLAAGCGIGLAARHVWLQSLPPDQVPACMPGLGYMLQVLPLQEVLNRVLNGDASCATITASFLGLSLPAWTLAGFAALAVWAILLPILSRRENA